MKNIAFWIICALFMVPNSGASQIYDPVKWSTTVEKVDKDVYKLIASASIEPKWHMYSQSVPEDGPIPTTFEFEFPEGSLELLGKTTEIGGHTLNDPVFNMQITYFENKAVFEQKIKILKAITSLDASVEFMVCDDEKCLPPTTEYLTFNIPENVFSNVDKEDKPIVAKKSLSEDGVPTTAVTPKSVKNTSKVMSEPEEEIVSTNQVKTIQDSVPEKSINKVDGVAKKKDTLDTASTSSSKGLWSIFIIAFLSGFAALLTPCVFPMIPLTVSFFTKQSKNRTTGIRNAIFYGVSIIVIYVLLGSVVTAIFGADSLNALATNVWFNIIFFILLVVFAISFMGAFEIVLPSRLVNKVDEQSYKKGGLIGIFFMALALAIVSFSCTGPIVGTLLVEAASKGGLAPIIGMLGFSLAIALPFAIFAAFPGWLNSLPKSGGWLNTVKVVLGFLELALAFKFLSQADLVLQLHLLEREVFLAIWIAIFGGLSLYLLGKIQLPHDSPTAHISVGRLCLALLTLSFTVYMIPGLWGAPLNLISAFPPPLEYSESPYGVGNSKNIGSIGSAAHTDIPEGGHLLAPHDILAFNDYEKGLAYAKKVGKPVMIDFTGWACVNCRKMEQNVWPRPKVLDILKNKVVLISLYVDDKRPLPDDTEAMSKLRPGKKLKYIGQKWSELQTIKYKANSQPFYVLMNHKEENLISPVAYTPNVDTYLNWLESGIAQFNKE